MTILKEIGAVALDVGELALTVFSLLTIVITVGLLAGAI